MPSAFENAVVQHRACNFSPKSLAMLKNIFKAVCEEATVLVNARCDRDALTTKIPVAGEASSRR
jgi:hypothetical protein